MHRFDLLTISNFLARLFTFTLDTTDIRYLCLHKFPPKRIVCSDRFTMHMLDPRVLTGRALKIIYIINGHYYLPAWTTTIMDVVKIWLNG